MSSLVRPGASLRRQLIVLSAGVTAAAVVLLTLLVQLLLARTTSDTVTQVLDDRAQAVIAAAEATSTSDALVVPDVTLDAGVAVYDDRARIVAGSAPVAVAEQYAELSTATTTSTVTVGDTSLVRAEPFTLASGASGVVVVTERLAPYEEAEHLALLVSILTGLLAVAASAGLAAWVSRRALSPVVRMAQTADDWSEHDLTRRFGLGAPDNEISSLAHTLDALLDKVAAAIRSEQRLTSELAHELRTPLTSVQATAELMALRTDLDAELREDVEAVGAGARRMAETISALLQLARSSAGTGDVGACDLRAVLGDVVADLGDAGAVVQVDVPDDLRVALPPALARRAISPLVDNAARLADEVRISVVPGRADCLTIAVDDNGAGVAEDLREQIFEPGRTTGAGSGLGLSLARRIARSAGGDVRFVDQAAGTRFVVELPRA